MPVKLILSFLIILPCFVRSTIFGSFVHQQVDHVTIPALRAVRTFLPGPSSQSNGYCYYGIRRDPFGSVYYLVWHADVDKP